VVGHAQNVEAILAVEVDELGKREPAVAPGRMRVQLTEKEVAHPS
jgi:hypothetical protein